MTEGFSVLDLFRRHHKKRKVTTNKDHEGSKRFLGRARHTGHAMWEGRKFAVPAMEFSERGGGGGGEGGGGGGGGVFPLSIEKNKSDSKKSRRRKDRDLGSTCAAEKPKKKNAPQ